MLWRHLMTALGRVGFPGVLLTHWISACFSHLYPEGQESGWYPFFHSQPLPPRGAEGGSARGSRGVMGQGWGTMPLPTIPPPISHEGLVSPFPTQRGDVGRDARMLMDHTAQQLSEKWFPTTALGQFPRFPQNSSAGWHILAIIPQMCRVSLHVLNHRWVKPSKTHCIHRQKNTLLRRSRQNTTAKSLGMHFKLQSLGKKGCKANRANPYYTRGDTIPEVFIQNLFPNFFYLRFNLSTHFSFKYISLQ